VNASKCDGCADAESSLQPGAGTACGELSFVSLLDRALGAFEIAKPGFGRRESARRARQQLDPEIGFQLSDRLRNRRLIDPKLPCGAGKGSRLDHPGEVSIEARRSIVVLPYSLWE
jgi:hypothetical protein